MSAREKIIQRLLFMVTGRVVEPPDIEQAWLELWDSDDHWDAIQDAKEELRRGQENTNLEPDTCRYYSSRSVAAPMLDGSWVGWTYYYGGGKHGEPWEMEWMEDAYPVTFEEVPVVIKQFRRLA